MSRIERAVLVISVIVGLVAIGVIIHKHTGGAKTGKNDPTFKTLAAVGDTPFLSGCAAVPASNDPVPDQDRDIVLRPDQKVDYKLAPPDFGPYAADQVQVNADGYYTADNAPSVESLMANLNAGWTVLWYVPNLLDPGQVNNIKKAAQVLHSDPRYSLFVAAAWDESRGKFPLGTPIALTRWTKTSAGNLGHVAYCHEPSGEAFREFMAFYGAPAIPGIDEQ
ncbi:MAG TPA: DUF3105 domain-containing protein [Sporichthyaceae bacterium]